MQQKYLHEHGLSNNLINNKIRQEMYLKHLRQVEKISNREAQTLRKDLKEYRSIAQIHKHNKIKAYEFRLRQKQRSIEQKNVKIHSKISSIGSDIKIGNRKTKCNSLHITTDSENINNQKSPQTKQRSAESSPKPSFHYAYRRRQQEQIQKQNAKLMKAILTQRSTILPAITQNKKRVQNELQNSRKSSNRYSSASKEIDNSPQH